MKKPITLDGIKYYYEIEEDYDDADNLYSVTTLFKSPIRKDVIKKILVNRGFLGLFGNEYVSKTETEDYYEPIGRLYFDIERTIQFSKEDCINKLKALIPKTYE